MLCYRFWDYKLLNCSKQVIRKVLYSTIYMLPHPITGFSYCRCNRLNSKKLLFLIERCIELQYQSRAQILVQLSKWNQVIVGCTWKKTIIYCTIRTQIKLCFICDNVHIIYCLFLVLSSIITCNNIHVQ